jgi:fibro-slime domain-containing protein
MAVAGIFLAGALGLASGCRGKDGSTLDPGAGAAASTGNGTSVGGGGAGGSSGAGLTTTGTGGSSSGSGVGGGICGGLLEVTVRDFSVAHPDFETFGGQTATTGLVQAELGADDKPVFQTVGNPAQLTGEAEFDQWYRDVPGVNHTFTITLQLAKVGDSSIYENNAFFPIDGMGFGNEGNPNNFHFTTEAHARFDYKGGEVFTFTGDDDLWMFINGHLALDLGGLHPELSATVDLDAMAAQLQIQVGGSYAMDIFHAERHTTQSNFRIETTIECFEPIPVPE